MEIPIIQWQDRQFVRISIQGYNDRDDVDALIQALTRLLAYMVVILSTDNLVGYVSYLIVGDK